MFVAIYKNSAGSISVFTPADSAVTEADLRKVAARAVPSGVPYKIVDASEVPTRELREAWGREIEDFDGGIGEGGAHE